MGKGEFLTVEVCLAALYLRGAPRVVPVKRRHWGLVRDALCSCASDLQNAPETLRASGLYDEAAGLETPGLVSWATDMVLRGCVATVVNESYPGRWAAALGATAPPAAWRRGSSFVVKPVSVVGNRNLSAADRRMSLSIGASIMSSGGSLVTGGALGADQQTILGALASGGEGRIHVVLPCGLNKATCLDGVDYWSICEPDAPFSAPQAMERNSLIYAASPLSAVVRARFKTGGTWTGATDALRRRLTVLAVRHVAGDQASQTLMNLGAIGFKSVADFEQLVRKYENASPLDRLDFDQTG